MYSAKRARYVVKLENAIPIVRDAGYAREPVWNDILLVHVVPYNLIDHVLRKILNFRHALGALLRHMQCQNLKPPTS